MSQKKLLPVIHVLDEQQALRNTRIAFEAGSDGVFLINHENENRVRELSYRDLLNIQKRVSDRFSGRWIGVNCLDLPAAEVFRYLTPQVSGVWVDDGEIDERMNEQVQGNAILEAKRLSEWQGLYFGGVAFKYQRPVSEVSRAAAIAQNYMDVVTTSGPATGHSASIEKIKLMKKAIQPKSLAIASGITAENVSQFLPWVDYFLVATGISHSFYELDAAKVKSLAIQIHEFKDHNEMNV